MFQVLKTISTYIQTLYVHFLETFKKLTVHIKEPLYNLFYLFKIYFNLANHKCYQWLMTLAKEASSPRSVSLFLRNIYTDTKSC